MTCLVSRSSHRWRRSHRSRALRRLGVVLAAVLALACGEPPIDRPNIVLIIGDDHGYPDSGFMGSEIVKTPHLDRLAAEGTVFTTAWNTGSTCRPSLLTLLTGLQPLQMELWLEANHRAPSVALFGDEIRNVETLPSLLARRGYRSFQAGKHWEGTFAQAGFTGGTKGTELDGLPLTRMAGGEKGLAVGRTTMQPVFEFLAAGSEPFLLWFAPRLPHLPMDAPPEIRARYDGIPLAESALAYYANVSRLDDAIGQLVAKLDELSLLERTLIVYVSDNGWDNAADVDYRHGRGAQIGGPSGKMSMRELGFRTPLVFHWPGRVPEGRVRDELVGTIDLFPTLLSFAGLSAPKGREGIDLRDAILNELPLPERSLYGYMEGALSTRVGSESEIWDDFRREGWFARTPRWHYLRMPKPSRRARPEQELFDLQSDPLETRDVAASHPDVVTQLRLEIDLWRKRMRSTLPSPELRAGEWRDPAGPQHLGKDGFGRSAQQPQLAGSDSRSGAGAEPPKDSSSP